MFFNEAEAVCNLDALEPEELEARPAKQGKTKGKKEQEMAGLKTNRIDHYMTEDQLKTEFGENGWKQLPDAVSRKYCFVPASVEVDEHHIGVYASKTDGHMANWIIRLGEEYLSVPYNYFHRKLYDYHVIQADETPVLVNRDGRQALKAICGSTVRVICMRINRLFSMNTRKQGMHPTRGNF